MMSGPRWQTNPKNRVFEGLRCVYVCMYVRMQREAIAESQGVEGGGGRGGEESLCFLDPLTGFSEAGKGNEPINR